MQRFDPGSTQLCSRPAPCQRADDRARRTSISTAVILPINTRPASPHSMRGIVDALSTGLNVHQVNSPYQDGSTFGRLRLMRYREFLELYCAPVFYFISLSLLPICFGWKTTKNENNWFASRKQNFPDAHRNWGVPTLSCSLDMLIEPFFSPFVRLSDVE